VLVVVIIGYAMPFFGLEPLGKRRGLATGSGEIFLFSR
jgi:hypothetical protein